MHFCDLAEDFCKQHATLLPDTVPPWGAYSLFRRGSSVLWRSLLQKGYVRVPSNPPLAPRPQGFFFLKKKDGGLHPCIDYLGLRKPQ